MGFLSSLFKGKTQEILEKDLGQFKALNNKQPITWQGTVVFLDSEVTLFMSGSETQLSESEKVFILDILNNQSHFELEIDKALIQEFDNAEEPYFGWRNHFKCKSISTTNNEIVITFEEKKLFHHFNIYFKDRNSVGVSIDT